MYLDSTKCNGIDNERTEPPISYWTKERLEIREEQEIRNGGFGIGELRELYEDDNDYEVESEDENDKQDCDGKSLKVMFKVYIEICIYFSNL